MTGHRIPVLVVGVGNLLMGDDGVGVHAVRRLDAAYASSRVMLLDAGTAILSVLGDVERADCLLFIDAIRTGAPPGTIHQLGPGELAPPRGPRSLHEYGVGHVLAQIPPALCPPDILIIGVEPASLDFGMTLSRPVHAALPRLIDLATGWIDDRLARRMDSSEQQHPRDVELIS